MAEKYQLGIEYQRMQIMVSLVGGSDKNYRLLSLKKQRFEKLLLSTATQNEIQTIQKLLLSFYVSNGFISRIC